MSTRPSTPVPLSDRPYLDLRGLSKSYGGAPALDGLSLELSRGRIHALVGENGAGKSTLAGLITGSIRPTAGEMLLDGRPVSFGSPRDAIAAGITAIDQELALVPTRSVIENVFLGSEWTRGGFVRTRKLRARFDELNQQSGFELTAGLPVAVLRTADQQKVEILRALARDVQLIVMDEPTASLAREDAEKLFGIVRSLKAAGTTIVYISHFLREVLDLADSVTVLRDGRMVRSGPAAEETPDSLVNGMIGRSLDVTFPEKRRPGEASPVVLSATGLERHDVFEDVSFSVRAGEILGIAGLVGSGRTEVARAVFGADALDAGTIVLDGREISIGSPRSAIRAGLSLLPEDRKLYGLHLQKSIVENVSLPQLRRYTKAGFLELRREREDVRQLTQRLGVRAQSVGDLVGTLSGGNQQRVLFGKSLMGRPRVLLADEPTRAIDIAAKRAIYELLSGLASDGLAIILISSELEEVLGLAHRVIVMRLGRVVAEFEGDVDQEVVTRAAFADSFESHSAVPIGEPSLANAKPDEETRDQ